MSAASFLHSSFLQVINAVMLWPVHVQKVPQASEHLECHERSSGHSHAGFTLFATSILRTSVQLTSR